ncbi:capsule assembly Wzi family protein [Zavarzinia sp. CC-PAN008]|uniref:capsule assembly Wzi family protein n=1 Tax=Zavarzinia sp. CC-PAN008 TaxID=3243332 RepID=UPI003F742802
MRVRIRLAAATCALLLGLPAALVTESRPAQASPWAEVGDDGLRSDIEMLAAFGLVDDMTTVWPLPWAGILRRLENTQIGWLPAHVEQAARRVRDRAKRELAPGVRIGALAGVTNRPAVVRDFGAGNRADYEAQVSLEFTGASTAGRLRLGGQGMFGDDRGRIMPDGSFLAQAIGGMVVYGGYMSHWWGPGQISALSLSNNARPFPHVGIARRDTAPFESPWLSWLGPWQAEFFFGLLDGDRIVADTYYNGLRFSFSPVEGLEIGLSRTQMLCGDGKRCDPFGTYFDLANDSNNINDTNDQGTIDIKYATHVGDYAVSAYGQIMNEDSNPIDNSGSSYLVGGSIWGPAWDDGAMFRLTMEYSDTRATEDLFSFGSRFGFYAYNNATYPDGMRYRGRTLGHSLDSESQLFSIQGTLVDLRGWRYQLTYHHASIASNERRLQPFFTNVVTTQPVTINLVESKVVFPVGATEVTLIGRVQDDQPRPRDGAEASIEGRFSYNF